MGPPAPEGCMGQVWEGTSPRWAGAPPTRDQRRKGEWEGQTLGQMGPKALPRRASPLSPSWPPPQAPSRAGRTPWGGGNPRWGRSPPPPLYILRFLGCHRHENVSFLAQPYPSSSSSSPAVLGEALRDCHAPPSPPRRRAAAGWSLPNLFLSPCWIKAWETSPGCMCVERGGTVVRCLDRIRPRSESLSERLHRPRSCNASASQSSRV